MTTTNTVASAPHIDALADETLKKIASFPGDYAQHRQLLADLKEDLVAQCATKSAHTAMPHMAGMPDMPEELRWSLARDMPDFSTDALYVKRYSLLSMASIVFLGFFVGGLLSGLLGLIDMGGGILRVGAVLGMLYGAEYLSGNPKARTRLLVFLGLGTLATFAASLAAGILRLTSWADFKSAVFGASGGPGLLKRLYLLLGATFLFVLLAKKNTSLDVEAFRLSLRRQAQERARYLATFFSVWGKLHAEIDALSETGHQHRHAGKCPRNDCPLALGLAHLLDGMDEQSRHFISEQLVFMGYTPGEGVSHILWDEEAHAALYDTVGLVGNGYRCRVLRRYTHVGDNIVKGHVQKETAGGTGA